MNTIGSVYYGWAFLIVCGGGSYYFAKRSVNAGRAERQAAETQRRLQQHQRQVAAATTTPQQQQQQKSIAEHVKHVDVAGSPSAEATSRQPVAGGIAAVEPGGRVGGKSKYESSEPYRSRKGDRFSKPFKE